MSEFDARRSKPQTVTNWVGKPLTITYAGTCIGCGSRVFDGGEDPRGVVPSKHFNTGATFEDGTNSIEFPACDDCNNDEPRYIHLMKRAERKGKRVIAARAATVA
jgi:hypothetical protein